MGKKAREYKSGDFIFAKVKGYPAWPARVQRPNGKKYFVYFYGTGETANLPPNQIFDYADNKDKLLIKTQKRKDFKDAVRQIQHDFANNVPLEDIIGVAEPTITAADETANDSTLDETADTTAADTTAADTTAADTSAADDEKDMTVAAEGAAVEDSDDGALVIDEAGKKGKKSTATKPKEPKEAKEPAAPKPKEAKTPRGRPKRDEGEEEKKEEEIVSRSGRKIRPKRFVDEQTEENATLPTSATKKKRGASPAAEKEKEKPEKAAKNAEPVLEKKTYNSVLPSELEDLKEPYPADVEINFYNDEKSLDTTQIEDTTGNKPAKVPVFGKKSINKSKLDKQNPKPKKFCPPTKLQPINSSQKFVAPIKNDSKSKENLTLESLTEKQKTVTKFVCFQKTNEYNNSEITADKQANDFDDEMMTQNCYNDQMMQKQEAHEIPLTLDEQRSYCLGNVILDSLNLLNDEDILLSQQNTQIHINNLITMDVRKIGLSEVTTLSQNGKVESICSVISLNKVYKNLDKQSFEDILDINENEDLENDPKEVEHKIPDGGDFLMLFQDGDAREKIKRFSGVMTPQIEPMEYVDWLDEYKMADQEKYGGDESDKENILICHLPGGQYVGIKLFRDRPAAFKSDAHRLNWDKRQADNAITLKTQLERGHISAQSVIAQLETELNLTDEEKANLDREREIEEKKCRVQFLKTEMKLIELDAKIKSCLSLEKADTELCIKLLDEMSELSFKPLMLLKHPTTAETVKRVRAYVGNAPSWQLSESDALAFSARAQRIREQADTLYNRIKELFAAPAGLSFWEYFMERVALYKKCTAKLTPDERLEMVHEPIELSSPSSHTMKAAIDAANDESAAVTDDVPPAPKKTKTPAKNKKAAAGTPAKSPAKRQSARARQHDEAEHEEKAAADAGAEPAKEKEPEPAEPKEAEPEKETKPAQEQNDKNHKDKPEKEDNKKPENKEESNGPTEQSNEDKDKSDDAKDSPKESNIENGNGDAEVEEEKGSQKEKEKKETEKKETEKDKKKEKEEDSAEPRAKRGRECNKKTEPPVPKSPAKRKSRS